MRSPRLDSVRVVFSERPGPLVYASVQYEDRMVLGLEGSPQVVARQLARFWEDHGAKLLQAAAEGLTPIEAGIR